MHYTAMTASNGLLWKVRKNKKDRKEINEEQEGYPWIKERLQFIIISLQMNFFPVFFQVEFNPFSGGGRFWPIYLPLISYSMKIQNIYIHRLSKFVFWILMPFGCWNWMVGHESNSRSLSADTMVPNKCPPYY